MSRQHLIVIIVIITSALALRFLPSELGFTLYLSDKTVFVQMGIGLSWVLLGSLVIFEMTFWVLRTRT
jgi:hypothetical protein